MVYALQLDHVDVEESLSPMSMQMISSSPTASIVSGSLSSKGMKYARQFQDFTPIDISRLLLLYCYCVLLLSDDNYDFKFVVNEGGGVVFTSDYNYFGHV